MSEINVEASLRALGIDPTTFIRSGTRWFPKGRFVPPKPGLVVQGRRCFVFSESEILVMAGPMPQAWGKSTARPSWHCTRPQLFPPVPIRMSSSELDRFLTGSPEDLRQLSYPKLLEVNVRRWLRDVFAKHVTIIESLNRRVSWGCLQCLVRIPGALDLWESNPALLVLCAYHSAFNFAKRTKAPFRVTRRLIQSKRRDILTHCGFLSSTLHVLERIPPADLSFKILFLIRKAMRDLDTRKLLLHAPDELVLNRVTVPFLSDTTRSMTSVYLLREMQKQYRSHKWCPLPRRPYGVYNTLRDIQRMREAMDVTGPFPRFRTIAEVDRVHARLCRRWNRWTFEKQMLDLSFPPQPLPDVEIVGERDSVVIQAIVQPAALYRHAAEVHNCVWLRGMSVAGGVSYIYQAFRRNKGDSLHTLEIVKQSRHWVLIELEASENRIADPMVRALVCQWLVREQLGSTPNLSIADVVSQEDGQDFWLEEGVGEP